MPQKERSLLRVEGKNDEHVIRHLLLRHDIDCYREDVAVNIQSIYDDGVEETGGDKKLLKGMEAAVKSSTGRSVGFILDADEVAEDRWRAVRGRLDNVGLALPDEIPKEGFVGEADTFKARVGVWLMPDNRRSGALEEFLQDLVDSSDPLLPIARTSTDQARDRGARFGNSDRLKAVLHAWLAWQENPGSPYGTAIKARYFSHASANALAFVEWFRRVFL